MLSYLEPAQSKKSKILLNFNQIKKKKHYEDRFYALNEYITFDKNCVFKEITTTGSTTISCAQKEWSRTVFLKLEVDFNPPVVRESTFGVLRYDLKSTGILIAKIVSS